MERKIAIPHTDLAVSPLGLGTVDAGLKWDGADADRIFDAYLDLGGNLVDTAHVYSDWVKPEVARSERVVGDWLSRGGKRNRIVLMTKGGHPDMTVEKPNLHSTRVTRGCMREDIESSLKKLRTDVIDLYFFHRDNEVIPAGELIDVMEEFRREGKIRYYACSNWSTARMREADAYARQKGVRGFVANQARLNLGVRYGLPFPDDTMVTVDGEMRAYHRENADNLLMPYMGVASGFFHLYLAGGKEAVKNSPYDTEGNRRVAARVRELTEKYGATVSQVVLGFFACQDFACAPLYGPETPEQLRDAAGAFDLPFTKADYDV